MHTISADVMSAARAAIDAAHAADPERLEDGSAAETLYADRIEAWMPRLLDEVDDLARLAARCQHLERWSIARNSYPMDRPGYLIWRRDLATRQGERAYELLLEAGVAVEICDQVRVLAAKKAPKGNPIAQAMEDAACLVFLEHQALAFAPTQGEAKMVPIVQKTWKKMSERGHAEALKLPMPEGVKAIVEKALAGA